MSDPRFVTVASFDEVYKAELAKTVLEEEGIDVQLHDREIVAMEWILSNSVGGIKVKVPEAEAERASSILAEKLSTGRYLAESLSEEELTRQALAERPDEGDAYILEPTEAAPEPEFEPGSIEERAAGVREDFARRFLRSAVFSMLFPPLWFYAMFLGLNAIFGPGRLSSEGQRRIFYGLIAFAFNWLFWVWMFTFTGGLVDWGDE